MRSCLASSFETMVAVVILSAPSNTSTSRSPASSAPYTTSVRSTMLQALTSRLNIFPPASVAPLQWGVPF